MELLIAAYPDKRTELPEATTEVYLRCLNDLPFEALQAALLTHITTNKWFPTIAELRLKSLEFLPGNRMPTATEAWDEVTSEISRVHWDGVPQFSHPAIAKTVHAMGWRQICLSETPGVERAHFLRMYETYAKRAQEDMLLLPEVAQVAERLALRGRAEPLQDKIRLLADAKTIIGGKANGQ